MKDKEIENFASHVLSELGLKGWRMEWTLCSGGECIKDMRKFTIPERLYGSGFEGKEYVLHEVAHIFTEDNYHRAGFYREYIKLLNLFMLEEQRCTLTATMR